MESEAWTGVNLKILSVISVLLALHLGFSREAEFSENI